jgi:hypothetical protein
MLGTVIMNRTSEVASGAWKAAATRFPWLKRAGKAIVSLHKFRSLTAAQVAARSTTVFIEQLYERIPEEYFDRLSSAAAAAGHAVSAVAGSAVDLAIGNGTAAYQWLVEQVRFSSAAHNNR